MKFKIGDRVRITDGFYTIGPLYEVVEILKYPDFTVSDISIDIIDPLTTDNKLMCSVLEMKHKILCEGHKENIYIIRDWNSRIMTHIDHFEAAYEHYLYSYDKDIDAVVSDESLIEKILKTAEASKVDIKIEVSAAGKARLSIRDTLASRNTQSNIEMAHRSDNGLLNLIAHSTLKMRGYINE